MTRRVLHTHMYNIILCITLILKLRNFDHIKAFDHLRQNKRKVDADIQDVNKTGFQNCLYTVTLIPIFA